MDPYGAALWRQLAARLTEARRLAAGWGPAIEVPGWLSPAVTLGAVLGLVIASGVAVASLGVFLTALLAAFVLLENVFGLSLTVG